MRHVIARSATQKRHCEAAAAAAAIYPPGTDRHASCRAFGSQLRLTAMTIKRERSDDE